MTAKRRPSMRTRMKAEDVSCWVEHNQQPPPTDQVRGVRFDAPPPRTESDTKSRESLTELPVPQDGGYGWFVVVCSFICHAVCDGISFCFGIFFVKVQNAFGTGRVISTVSGTFFLSLPLVLAPIAGVVVDINGCSRSLMIGGSICTIFSFLSMFAPNIYVFTLLFGVGCGAGMSLIYNAAIVIVTYYFSTKRGMATSCAVAGTGVGTFAFPAILGWSQTIFASINLGNDLQANLSVISLAFFIVAVIGFVVKDVEWVSDSTDYKLRKFEKNVRDLIEDEENTTMPKKINLRRANSLPSVKMSNGSIMCNNNVGKKEVPARSKSVALFDNQPTMPSIPEYSMLHYDLANLDHLDLELANSPCNTVKAQRRRVTSNISMSVDQINEMDEEDLRVNFLSSAGSSSECETESSSDYSELSQDGDSSSSELSEKIVDPETPLTAPLDQFARSASSAPTSARVRNSLAPGNTNTVGGRILASNAIQASHVTNLLAMGKIPSAPELVARKKRRNLLAQINVAIIKRLVENDIPVAKEVLGNKAYQHMLFSVICLYLILDVPYVCFHDFGLESQDVSERSATTIYSVIGVANLVSTIAFGKMADNKWTKNYISEIYAGSMSMVSFIVMMAPFITSDMQFYVVGALFGIFVTSNYVLQSVLVTDICDITSFQIGYTMISTAEGISSLIGPVFFAEVREFTGSYTGVFLTSGVIMLFSTYFAFRSSQEFKKMKNAEEEQEQEAIEGPQINGTVTYNCANGNNGERETLLLV